MPMTLEEFRKLSSTPVGKDGVKKSGKCDWDKVLAEIQGKGWSVKEVWEIAKKHSGEKGISRVRTMKWLNKLVEKKLGTMKVDGLSHVYWINPVEVKKTK